MTTTNRDVFIVDGARTPFLKAAGKPGEFSASDLAVAAGRQLLMRQNFAPDQLDEVIVGCVMPSPEEVNIARIIALRLHCGNRVPAWTVQRNCASGLQALDNAVSDIRLGRANLVMAGGTDAMSHAPLLYNKAMVNWLSAWFKAKSLGKRAQLITKVRPHFLAPVIALLRGLMDPIVGLSMGQTAENLAFKFGITRQEMDAYALQSQQRLASSHDEAVYQNEIVELYARNGEIFSFDNGVRRDSTMERLAKLKPYFDKKYGDVTPGNSAQVTDGAALLILASEESVKKHKLPVIAKIVDTEWAALDPAQMGLGPVHAATSLMNNHALKLDDIDYWEINEAFAAQVLACVNAWQDEDYCKNELDLKTVMGELDPERLNIDGGAIGIGHPVGASGARIVLHMSHLLKRKKAQRGIASLCIGGGQGGAMLIETV